MSFCLDCDVYDFDTIYESKQDFYCEFCGKKNDSTHRSATIAPCILSPFTHRIEVFCSQCGNDFSCGPICNHHYSTSSSSSSSSFVYCKFCGEDLYNYIHYSKCDDDDYYTMLSQSLQKYTCIISYDSEANFCVVCGSQLKTNILKPKVKKIMKVQQAIQ